LRTILRQLVAGEAPWPLVLHGPAGTGKTAASLCLLDYAGGEYWTVSGFCKLMIQSEQGRLEWSECGRGGVVWPEQLWNRVAAAPLVVLDELGCRDKVSDAHYENVKTVIDERKGKPFVAISNHPLSQLAAIYDDRVFSRLSEGTVVELAGADRRVSA
jgi:DNA replication protein DnaC